MIIKVFTVKQMYDIIETNIEEEVQLMKRCSLCGRKISNEGYCFGLSCLKRSCILNNSAMLSTSFNVINEYNITIKFSIEREI